MANITNHMILIVWKDDYMIADVEFHPGNPPTRDEVNVREISQNGVTLPMPIGEEYEKLCAVVLDTLSHRD